MTRLQYLRRYCRRYFFEEWETGRRQSVGSFAAPPRGGETDLLKGLVS